VKYCIKNIKNSHH